MCSAIVLVEDKRFCRTSRMSVTTSCAYAVPALKSQEIAQIHVRGSDTVDSDKLNYTHLTFTSFTSSVHGFERRNAELGRN